MRQHGLAIVGGGGDEIHLAQVDAVEDSAPMPAGAPASTPS
jgi:hypothetical protein